MKKKQLTLDKLYDELSFEEKEAFLIEKFKKFGGILDEEERIRVVVENFKSLRRLEQVCVMDECFDNLNEKDELNVIEYMIEGLSALNEDNFKEWLEAR